MRVELGKYVSLKETSQNPPTRTTKEESRIDVRNRERAATGDSGNRRERQRRREWQRERAATTERGNMREFLFECLEVRWKMNNSIGEEISLNLISLRKTKPNSKK